MKGRIFLRADAFASVFSCPQAGFGGVDISRKYDNDIATKFHIFYHNRGSIFTMVKMLALSYRTLGCDNEICVAATSHVFFSAWFRLRTFLFIGGKLMSRIGLF